jgi:hypothetical protein
MNLRALTVNVDRVEHNIQPPMFQAITLPIQYDEKEFGVSVYVSVSLFASEFIADAKLQRIATEIARRINQEKA